MRRLLLTIAAAGALAARGPADDPKPDAPKKPEVTLKVGDPAPAFKADTWAQGDEVKAFEPGKVYVVEFWATWCGPCISAMPHLAQLQARYRDQGVTFIGYSAKDPNNSAEKVAAFVARRGPKLKYTFAYSDGKETYDAWMKAAGQAGIPCTFVVGRDTKLAYIGHPIYLDSVIPKVVDGSWKSAEGLEEVNRAKKDLMALNKAAYSKDPAANLRAIEEFEARNPGMAHAGYFVGQKVDALVKLKRTADAKTAAEGAIAEAARWGDVTRLRTLSAALRGGPDGDKTLWALSLRAAEELVAVAGDKDPSALLNLAATYNAGGDKVKASAFADRAVEAAAKESPALKRYAEQEAAKIRGNEKKADGTP